MLSEISLISQRKIMLNDFTYIRNPKTTTKEQTKLIDKRTDWWL